MVNKIIYPKKIKELRREKGISQEELAKLLGVSRQTVISVETGRSQPSLPLAFHLCQIFDQAVDEMFADFILGGDLITQAIRKEQPMSHLTVWNPLKDLDDIHRELDRVFTDNQPRNQASLVPAINVCETDQAILIDAAVPGYKEDEIDVEVTDNVLTLKGEKKIRQEQKEKNWVKKEYEHQVFERSFRLPEEVNEDKIEAKITDGVLSITLPKIEPAESKSKKIAVKKA